jgi:leader peptidase (prepilin peptidase)/N-methyltransferase
VRKLVGRCPACDTRERWRPALVELGMALVFAFVWFWYDGFSVQLLVTSMYMTIFALILVTDMEHRLILHVVTFPGIVLALLASFATITPVSALLGAAAGFALFFAIYLVGGLVYGAGAMGFGDVTLSTLIGAAVGFPFVLVALLLGILAGGIITIFLLLSRIRRMSSKIPYGPFLLLGATVTLLWGDRIVAWYLR